MKIAIAGTGKIIPTALEAISAVDNIMPTAIFVRPHSMERGKSLAEKYSISAIYTDYRELLHEADCDTVYIGNVNTVHYNFAREALLAGKNVIMEKPFTLTGAEAEELAELADKQQLYIFEAITTRHAEALGRIRDLIPEIGRITLVLGNYSQYSSRYRNYLKGDIQPAFDPALYGGALTDLGIYNLALAVDLFGMPETYTYSASRGYNGVDLAGILTMNYGSFTAALAAAKDSDGPNGFTIQGENGWIRLTGSPNEMEHLEWKLDGQMNEWRPKPTVNRLEYEFREFEACVRENRYEEMRKWMSVTVDATGLLENAIKRG